MSRGWGPRRGDLLRECRYKGMLNDGRGVGCNVFDEVML